MRAGLQSERRGATAGQARAAVVFLHGYGADGADLLGLAEPLAPHLPGVAFYAPDAPEPCLNNPMGCQWFPIPWLDGSSEAAALAGMQRSAAELDAFLDGVLSAEGLGPQALALVGFSQGTMMALQVAPRRSSPLAGVVGFSGRLLQPDALVADTLSRPPVLLIHGDADEVVPVQALSEASRALRDARFDVDAHVLAGLGHGISPEGLSMALGFLRKALPGGGA